MVTWSWEIGFLERLRLEHGEWGRPAASSAQCYGAEEGPRHCSWVKQRARHKEEWAGRQDCNLWFQACTAWQVSVIFSEKYVHPNLNER